MSKTDDGRFAATPGAACYAVIFSSQLGPDVGGYDEMAERMVALAREQPGYLGIESARDASGFGITVSYWETEVAIQAWRANTEHRIAQETGRARWYEHYELRVARIERSYRKRR